MGQGTSKVHVHVHLDKAYYYSGDTVTGSVVLHLENPIDVKSINVKITGVEKCEWKERKQSGQVTHVETYKGKHVIFKHKLPLSGRSTISRGDYQWPISFQLPPGVPGTFHYEQDDTKASVEYKLKADIDQEGMFKPDFKKTIKFDVMQRTKLQQPSGPVNLTKDQPISSWCCFNKGIMNMHVATDTDTYLPGETINVRAEVDNKSSVEVSVVEMKLNQRLHIIAQDWLIDRNKHTNVTRVITRQQAKGGAAGAPNQVSHYQGTLALDRSFEATCLGKVVKSMYELEVIARTGCCLTEVVLKQPIIINDPQPVAAPPAVAPPPGWAPQVYPLVTFTVPAPEYYNGWQTTAVGVPVGQQQASFQPQVQQPIQPAVQPAPGPSFQRYPSQYPRQQQYPQQYPQQHPEQYPQQQQYQEQYPQQYQQQPSATVPVGPGMVFYQNAYEAAAVCTVGQQQEPYKHGHIQGAVPGEVAPRAPGYA